MKNKLNAFFQQKNRHSVLYYISLSLGFVFIFWAVIIQWDEIGTKKSYKFIRCVHIPRHSHWHIRVKMTANMPRLYPNNSIDFSNRPNQKLTADSAAWSCSCSRYTISTEEHRIHAAHILIYAPMYACVRDNFQFLPNDYDSVSSCCQRV